MPTPKQMEKLSAAAAVGNNAPPAHALGPGDDLPPDYWAALLADPRADTGLAAPSVRTLRLSEIVKHLLRVSCSRCGRILEIQKADAVRLYGSQAVWSDVAQRLLDNTCQQRTGRHEEDGCWPSHDAP